MSEQNPDVTRIEAAEELGGRHGGFPVEITMVDGGYIVSWREAVVKPESNRQGVWDTFQVVKRTAVRENLDAALEVVRQALQGDRIHGSKWG